MPEAIQGKAHHAAAKVQASPLYVEDTTIRSAAQEAATMEGLGGIGSGFTQCSLALPVTIWAGLNSNMENSTTQGRAVEVRCSEHR